MVGAEAKGGVAQEIGMEARTEVAWEMGEARRWRGTMEVVEKDEETVRRKVCE